MSNNQRANIQYSVPLEDLSKEVARLATDGLSKLLEISTTVTFSSDEVLTLSTLEQIDAVRQSLTDVDLRLSEVSNMINGFIAFKANPGSAEQPQSQTFEQTHPSSFGEFNMNIDKLKEMGIEPEGIEELQSKINNFKKMMNNPDSSFANTTEEQEQPQ